AATIIVIRILQPSDYGLMAMAAVLLTFVYLFASLGLGRALVQSSEVEIPMLRRVFGLAIVVNGVMFMIACAGAPAIAAFFSEPRLLTIVPVMAAGLLISTPNIIPNSMLDRDLEFKGRSIVDTTGTIVHSLATVALALAGFGVWSLIYGGLIGHVWRAVGSQMLSPFLRLPSFAFRGMGHIVAFGGYVSLVRL